jgi:hypothetical protein
VIAITNANPAVILFPIFQFFISIISPRSNYRLIKEPFLAQFRIGIERLSILGVNRVLPSSTRTTQETLLFTTLT